MCSALCECINLDKIDPLTKSIDDDNNQLNSNYVVFRLNAAKQCSYVSLCVLYFFVFSGAQLHKSDSDFRVGVYLVLNVGFAKNQRQKILMLTTRTISLHGRSTSAGGGEVAMTVPYRCPHLS